MPGCNEYKKRGYVLKKEDSYLYSCHNECGNMSFYSFLKHHDVNIANEFYKTGLKDKFKNRSEDKSVFKKTSELTLKKFNKKTLKFKLSNKVNIKLIIIQQF